MTDDSAPGLERQSTVRTVARVLAVVLLLGGAVLVVLGLRAFAAAANTMGPMSDPLAPSGFEAVLLVFAGGVCVILGLVAVQVGWLRAGTTYVAGETMPVVKESLAYVTAGPHCRQCGTRNDQDATFCDSCGQSLA